MVMQRTVDPSDASSNLVGHPDICPWSTIAVRFSYCLFCPHTLMDRRRVYEIRSRRSNRLGDT